jgi:GT2 family glycosyltransferase
MRRLPRDFEPSRHIPALGAATPPVEAPTDSAAMNLTLIVPTHNRPDLLARLLRSLEAAKPVDMEWDLLVVDNNSAPRFVPELETQVAGSPLPVRLLHEPRPGKSRALNTAIRAARGEFVAFLDDDVTVHGGYLVGLEAAIRRGTNNVFGGRVLPIWPYEPPDWITGGKPLTVSRGPIVAHDYGDTPHEYDETMRRPIGCNFFCRRSLFERLGYFDERLGPGASSGLMGGEESVLLKRFQDFGERILYVPEVTIEHPVDPARMTRSSFRLRLFASGRSGPYIAKESFPSVFGVPRFFFRRLASAVAGTVWARLRGDWRSAFDHELEICRFSGAIYESRRMQRARRHGKGQ